MSRGSILVVLLAGGVLAGVACGGGRSASPATPPAAPPAVQPGELRQLFEAGRYEDVVSGVRRAPAAAIAPEGRFLAGQSLQRLARPGEAEAEYSRLAGDQDGAWRAVGEIALAVLRNDPAADGRVSTLAASYPNHPFVQFEVGHWRAARGRWDEAAAAFDRSAEADRTFAYAYYYAGLAYYRIQRPDRMTARFETFLKLAPDAPERPEVEGLLRTMRG